MRRPIQIYRQERDAQYLKENPQETWRCDIFPDDGSDHHGVGATDSEALLNAAMAYRIWQGAKK